MKKIVLLDGNNLLFRSYYATAYSGSIMKNSKNFPTNALYGFVNMLNKIINEENPEYIMVAFDIGTNFRKEFYQEYKEGRSAMPDELKVQFPKAKEILDAMGITHYELEPFEADDIIGTFARYCDDSSDCEGLIISSDKDLLQLISSKVSVKLLKTKESIKYNPTSFLNDWGFEPIKMIDYKALAGDPSDNIPGVKGVGEKTAINLLSIYGSLDNIYNNIDNIKGALKTKLINDKDNAFLSQKLATIYTKVPIDFDLEKIKYRGAVEDKLNSIYTDLEFYSLLKNNKKEKKNNKDFKYLNVLDASEIPLEDDYAIYIECDKENYHDANVIGMGIATKKNNYYVSKLLINDCLIRIEEKIKYTYDLKKNICLLNKDNISINNCIFDTMIASYLLEENTKEDISYLMHNNGIDVTFYHESLKNGFTKDDIVKKARFIYDTRNDYIKRLKMEQMDRLFNEIEMPLISVLADMEISGIKCDKKVLEEMSLEYKDKINELTKKIYQECNEEFNISSPKQLGVVLFEKLGLPGKKTKNGYKTDADTLKKLLGSHEVIKDILEYRGLTKIYNTYLEGLIPYIKEDGKIHTIYKQNLTRTGRLSSVEPNMQNIPAKDEEEKKIKKAFLPTNDLLLSCDYSQIELRLLAHISGSKELQEAFNNDEDIHARVAADINGIPISEVTKKQRKTAKAVIFGIVYGISGFGLGENLNISPTEAKAFIDKYYKLYPGVKKYMDNCIEEAHNTGCVRTLFNRKRTVDEINNKSYIIRQAGERIALNTPIQGTGADIMKKAMVDIYRDFKKNNIKSKMILQVHDELIFDLVLSEKDIVTDIVTNDMENAIKLDVPIKVSHDYGTNWYEMK